MAEAALQRVGLAELAETVTATLSHGQRRQLEVAVALTLSPKLFLMDEPMAGLGLEGTAAMTELLDGLGQAWAYVGLGQLDRALMSFDEVADTPGLRNFGNHHKAMAVEYFKA